MNDQRVSAAQDQLDDEARADAERDHKIKMVKSYLLLRDFELLATISGHDFIDWYADRYEKGNNNWPSTVFIYWYCDGNLVDTEAVATEFIDWIGEE